MCSRDTLFVSASQSPPAHNAPPVKNQQDESVRNRSQDTGKCDDFILLSIEGGVFPDDCEPVAFEADLNSPSVHVAKRQNCKVLAWRTQSSGMTASSAGRLARTTSSSGRSSLCRTKTTPSPGHATPADVYGDHRAD